MSEFTSSADGRLCSKNSSLTFLASGRSLSIWNNANRASLLRLKIDHEEAEGSGYVYLVKAVGIMGGQQAAIRIEAVRMAIAYGQTFVQYISLGQWIGGYHFGTFNFIFAVPDSEINVLHVSRTAAGC